MTQQLSNTILPPPGRLRVVIDTDTANSIDDQFAIAWALRSPERIDVEAIYAAPYSKDIFKQMDASGAAGAYIQKITYEGGGTPEEGMLASYREIRKVCDLCGVRMEDRIFRGAPRFMRSAHDPIDSEAVQDLIRRAKQGGPLYVVCIAAITNVASALMIDPSIRDNLVLVWLAGEPLHFPHGFEYNLSEDLFASRYIFDCGVPLVYIPCMSVASHLSISKEEVQAQLAGKNPICDYLAGVLSDLFPKNASVADEMMLYNKAGNLKGVYDLTDEESAAYRTKHYAIGRIIWDIAPMAYVMNPTWCPCYEAPSPVLLDHSRWGAVDEGRHRIKVCSYLFRDCIFGDLMAKLNGND